MKRKIALDTSVICQSIGIGFVFGCSRFPAVRDVERRIMDPRNTAAVLCAVMLYLNAGVAVAMQVTSNGPQTIQKAQGEKAALECTYTPGSNDVGDLDIEWSLVSPDMTQKDTLILSFAGGRKWIHGDPSLTKGLDFRAGDPSHGDASISISALEVSHTGTYQCKVKKAPGVDMRKVTLVVMVPPSVPTCRAEGSPSIGGALSLHCKSSQGSTPLHYVWEKAGGAGIHPSITQDSITGVLHISNHSETFAGMYRCEASNAVGSEHCTFALRAEKPPSRAGVIAGTVIGVLLLIIILLLLVCLLICRYGRRCKDKEVANDIREDSPPPESRTQSRISAFRPGVAYSSVGTGQPWAESEFSSDLTDSSKALKPPSSTSTGALRRAYDSRYGHPV
ncbi:V-set and immunoglobulin domain-containing protein 8a isoform X1 [Conger conger]|uniref:V-set and immunoglobulin domain-containing protein 8a isoform X1 n=2 Tax=Conger conger TaxID=82655 RepID=UPI002A5A5743|nr:V-set and immunoglobulin domain-containing protein 8a isoform X1 [Conger conger]